MKTIRGGRRKGVPNWKVTGSSLNLSAFGPYVCDAKTGILIEKRKAVRQGSGWVMKGDRLGSFDRPDEARPR